MVLEPKDIAEKNFSTTFLRGYCIREVDEFLDRIEAEMGRLTQTNRELREKIAALEKRLAEGGDGSQSLLDRVEALERRIL